MEPQNPTPSAPKSWKCACTEYNNHSIGAMPECRKCGVKELQNPTPSAEMQKLLSELESECMLWQDGVIVADGAFDDLELGRKKANNTCMSLINYIRTLEKQNAKMREALEEIVYYQKQYLDHRPLSEEAADDMVCIAKEALSPLPTS